MKTTRLLSITLALSAAMCFAAIAQNRVVVIPLGADGEPLKNVVTVSAQNGDFTSLSDAMASITDASFDNSYLIVMGPGTFTLTEQVIVKSYVSIQGSGVLRTRIEGNVSGNAGLHAALIVLASDTSISDLTMRNSGATNIADFRTGVFVLGNPSSRQRVENVHIQVDAEGNGTSYGIESSSADALVSDTRVDVTPSTGGPLITSAVHVQFGILSITDSLLISIDGSALSDTGSGEFDAKNLVLISFSGGHGLVINNNSSKIVQSQLFAGTVDDNSGSKNCLDLYNINLVFLTC